MYVFNHAEIIEAQKSLHTFKSRRVTPIDVFIFVNALLKDGKSLREIKVRLMSIVKADELQEAADFAIYTDETDQVQAIVRIASKILNRMLTDPQYSEVA